MATWRIGVDIGGAFTDLYAVDVESGESKWIKVESTPPNFERGVLEGIEELENEGVFIRDATQIVHGQTVVINSIITRSGANVGFLTTEGFDTLEIQRANRRDIFNFRYKKPTPFVSRYMTEWINERINPDGSIHKPLNEEEVIRATERLLAKGAKSFAIGFVDSYVNPIHEIKAKEIVERVLREKGIERPFVTISSDLSREWREYERFNTAVLNAYVQPIFVDYVEKLEKVFNEKGFQGVFYITLSSGGVITSQYAKKYPILTIEGGPISGIQGGVHLARSLDTRNIIVLDGGSTTTKAGLAKDLTPKIYTEYWIERDEWNAGYPLRVSTIDITEIGLGGTSILWVGDEGNLHVGPKAAGARPGPVCYGFGGDKPTLTDAYVVAGYLNPEYLLGGRLKIYKDRAVDAMKGIADALNLDVAKAAQGAVKIANSMAANLIRQISIMRGYDPRDFVLVAHGGSGPMFAPFIAEELKIPQIIVPTIPSGVFNAWGMLGLDIKHELVQTNIMPIERSESFLDSLNEIFVELENKVKGMFKEEGFDPEGVSVVRYLDMMYEGQAHTLKIPCPSKRIEFSDLEVVIDRFHEAHYNEYGFKLPESGIYIINFHIVGVYSIKPLEIAKRPVEGSLRDAFLGERTVLSHEGKEISIPVYKKEKIPTNTVIKGPCIIEGDTSTIVVTEKFKAIHDDYGNIVEISGG